MPRTRSRRRRPPVATLIALTALFVALGGPAEARKLFTGKDIKNGSLTTKELSKKTVTELKSTPRGSINERSLANGAVSSGKLDDAAVTAGKIAPASIDATRLTPNSVGPRELHVRRRRHRAARRQRGDQRQGGRLGARRARHHALLGPLPDHGSDRGAHDSCWSAEPVGLAPELAGADIAPDLVLATPDAAWPERQLAFSVRNSANRSRFVLAACNVTETPTHGGRGLLPLRRDRPPSRRSSPRCRRPPTRRRR